MEVEIPTEHRAPKVEASAWRWRDLPGAAAKPLRDPLLAVNFLLLAVGAACGPLLLRLYFLRGGSRKWLSSLLQTAGWPLLLLAFTAAFALLLVRQRFTGSTVNAIVLLSVGAAMLGMGSGGDRPAGVSGAQYAAGFGMALAAAALYGLVLPVMELSQAWHAARAGAAALTYTLVVEIQVVIGLTATAFCAVGMLANNDFQMIDYAHRIILTTPSLENLHQVRGDRAFEKRLHDCSLKFDYILDVSLTALITSSTTDDHLIFITMPEHHVASEFPVPSF
uniref:Uncharacterized protein n=1 Tax=Aegilops tauschii TaxID=37682 RepID=M8ARZ3_AEGTA